MFTLFAKISFDKLQIIFLAYDHMFETFFASFLLSKSHLRKLSGF